MTIQKFDRISPATITHATVEAITERARAYRSEALAALLIELGTQFRRLAAKLRPSHQRLPQSGAWAR